MIRFRKMMLEELPRRNYSAIITRNYLRVVADFVKHFGKMPDKLGQRTSNLPSLSSARAQANAHDRGETGSRTALVSRQKLKRH
ncbi:MAG: hypothetical protein JO249_20505 [Acidobacteria bacterium]|nr:hypothetical protein [Acidobacteriota bacterium]